MNFDRLDELRKKHGVSNSFLCDLVGRKRYYINDCRNKGTVIPDEYIKRWAEALETTPEYLNGETDIKEQPATNDDGLTEEQREIIELFDRADPAVQRAALEFLRAIERREHKPDNT